jgi:hypothetical protein
MPENAVNHDLRGRSGLGSPMNDHRVGSASSSEVQHRHSQFSARAMKRLPPLLASTDQSRSFPTQGRTQPKDQPSAFLVGDDFQ